MTEKTLGEKLDLLDAELTILGNKASANLKFRLLALQLDKRIELVNKIKSKHSVADKVKSRIVKKNDNLSALAFSFPEHGIYLEHGVNKYRKKNSPEAEKGKQPWLSDVLPGTIEDLADILERDFADIAAGELRIMIPGVIDTKISIG